MEIVKEILSGNKRALARAITIVENEDLEGQKNKEQLLKEIYPYTGKAYIIGITGSPGAGKSSLVNKLTEHIRRLGLTVGILAVDPTSPFTGGALLGDRIRMQDHFLDPGVFIRSMGTRGSLGGLAKSTKDVVKVLDAFGMDIIIIETVGVGQSELDVMYAADSTVVVLTPGAGDVVQTLKAGIMEIADIFAVNKADMVGADKVVTQVEAMLDLKDDIKWRPPVVKVVSTSNQGLDSLYEAIEKHRKYLEKTGELDKVRKERALYEVAESAVHRVRAYLNHALESNEELVGLLEKVTQKTLSPDEAANTLLANIKFSDT
ncbi:MAG: lao/ao transport system ATPase [Clostridiales bacterium]|nr:lao/ao transport system ATPase [Clostridiales bacterium]